MLRSGVAACHRYGIVLFTVLSSSHTQHSRQYTHHTYDMIPHHRITYYDVIFFTEF